MYAEGLRVYAEVVHVYAESLRLHVGGFHLYMESRYVRVASLAALSSASNFSTARSGMASLASAARLGGTFQALIPDVAGKLRWQVEFVVDDVFHMDAGGAGVFQHQW